VNWTYFCRKLDSAAVYLDMQTSQTRTERSDDDLVREVLTGNREAYADLVRRYERQVHAVVWAIVRNHQIAEDMAQEAFIKAYGKLATLREQGKFGAWLLLIARRTATDFVRNKDRLVIVPTVREIPASPSPAEEDATVVLSALTRIPDREQQVLFLRYFDDLAVADIAHILGCPVGTVTKSISRALSRLRDYLKEKP
jgi:RNA polymerase sigma-70 factor (ECF subfamily)